MCSTCRRRTGTERATSVQAILGGAIIAGIVLAVLAFRRGRRTGQVASARARAAATAGASSSVDVGGVHLAVYVDNGKGMVQVPAWTLNPEVRAQLQGGGSVPVVALPPAPTDARAWSIEATPARSTVLPARPDVDPEGFSDPWPGTPRPLEGRAR